MGTSDISVVDYLILDVDKGDTLTTNRVFLVHFGGTIRRVWSSNVSYFDEMQSRQRSMARANKPDILPRRTQECTIRYLPLPKFGPKSGYIRSMT